MLPECGHKITGKYTINYWLEKLLARSGTHKKLLNDHHRIIENDEQKIDHLNLLYLMYFTLKTEKP